MVTQDHQDQEAIRDQQVILDQLDNKEHRETLEILVQEVHLGLWVLRGLVERGELLAVRESEECQEILVGPVQMVFQVARDHLVHLEGTVHLVTEEWMEPLVPMAVLEL